MSLFSGAVATQPLISEDTWREAQPGDFDSSTERMIGLALELDLTPQQQSDLLGDPLADGVVDAAERASVLAGLFQHATTEGNVAVIDGTLNELYADGRQPTASIAPAILADALSVFALSTSNQCGATFHGGRDTGECPFWWALLDMPPSAISQRDAVVISWIRGRKYASLLFSFTRNLTTPAVAQQIRADLDAWVQSAAPTDFHVEKIPSGFIAILADPCSPDNLLALQQFEAAAVAADAALGGSDPYVTATTDSIDDYLRVADACLNPTTEIPAIIGDTSEVRWLVVWAIDRSAEFGILQSVALDAFRDQIDGVHAEYDAAILGGESAMVAGFRVSGRLRGMVLHAETSIGYDRNEMAQWFPGVVTW